MIENIQLNSVEQYNQMYGLETLHPLATVVDLSKASKSVNHVQIHYGLYALFLKNGKDCVIKYGRRDYDYQEGSMLCFAPGQVAQVSMKVNEFRPKVYGVLFHPDLIRGTSLRENIKNYGFFSYQSNEALHLSEQERRVFTDCLSQIQLELEHPADKHSKQLIAKNIELLLAHCLRFYERQFITREVVNQSILQKFEKDINEYLENISPEKAALPSVSYFAKKVCLSPNYFGDLIKKESGKSAQEYIQYKLIERSKDLILGSRLSISEIAYELGFSYPQHFGRIFKKQTGMTPTAYRLSE